MALWIALRLTSPEPDRDLAPLLALASTVTSHVTVHRCDTVLLDVQASLAFFGSVRSLRWQLRQAMARTGLPLTASLACTAMGAWVLLQAPPAHPRRWCLALSARRLIQRLGQLSVASLPEALPHLTWLKGIGCKQLRQLMDLPRDELARRTHPELLQAVDQALGRIPFVYRPHALPERFCERLELTWRVQEIDQLSYPLQRLLKNFSQWLGARQLAVRRFECRLQHHEQNHAHRPTSLSVGLSQPAWQASALWALLAAQLQTVGLPTAVTAIVLSSETLCARPMASRVLFETPRTQLGHCERTLDLLRARLGPAAVRQAQPRADWRPERANQWTTQATASELDPRKLPINGSHNPAWLLRVPRALQVKREQPWLNGPLRLLQGPYRIETGWWDKAFVLRDYFVATDTNARRYWIYRERDSDMARWYLHGLFG